MAYGVWYLESILYITTHQSHKLFSCSGAGWRFFRACLKRQAARRFAVAAVLAWMAWVLRLVKSSKLVHTIYTSTTLHSIVFKMATLLRRTQYCPSFQISFSFGLECWGKNSSAYIAVLSSCSVLHRHYIHFAILFRYTQKNCIWIILSRNTFIWMYWSIIVPFQAAAKYDIIST